jgi:hypothetical protein
MGSIAYRSKHTHEKINDDSFPAMFMNKAVVSWTGTGVDQQSFQYHYVNGRNEKCLMESTSSSASQETNRACSMMSVVPLLPSASHVVVHRKNHEYGLQR